MLAAEGANVALVDLAVDKLPAVQREIEGYGVKAFSVGMDLTDEKRVKEMVDEVKGTWGTIDGLFNNAGYQVQEFPTFAYDPMLVLLSIRTVLRLTKIAF